MRIIDGTGAHEVWRFPGTSAFKLAIQLLLHPTYTIIVLECDDWYSDLKLDVDYERKVIRIGEKDQP